MEGNRNCQYFQGFGLTFWGGKWMVLRFTIGTKSDVKNPTQSVGFSERLCSLGLYNFKIFVSLFLGPATVVANFAMADALEDLAPRSADVEVLETAQLAVCDPILEMSVSPVLTKRFVRILTSAFYDEMVRTLFYLGEVPAKTRQTLDEVTVVDRKSQKTIHLNLARLRLVQKLFLQQENKELDVHNIVHAHLRGATYLPLWNALASWLTFQPFSSGLLSREYVLVETIAQEVWALHKDQHATMWIDGDSFQHKIDKIRLEKFKRLYMATWHSQIIVNSPKQADIRLLPTAALFYAESGLGALAEIKKK